LWKNTDGIVMIIQQAWDMISQEENMEENWKKFQQKLIRQRKATYTLNVLMH